MKLWPEPANEFERRWLHNWLTVFLPGSVIFGLGGVTGFRPVVVGGAGIAAIGLFRGWRIMARFRTCTGCGKFNSTRLRDDGYCVRCGIELPLNGPDLAE